MNHQEAGTNGDLLTATGVAGLDDVLGGGLTRDRLYLVEGNPGAGKTTLALHFLLHGAERGEAGSTSRSRRRRTSWTPSRRRTAGRSTAIDILELVAPEEELEPDNQYRHVPAVRGRAGRHDQGDPRRGRAGQAEAGRHRLALRDAAAGPEPAPLPPADPGAEAVLHRPGLHGPAPRRPDVRVDGPAAPEHRPRRAEPRAALAGVRRRAAAAPGREAPRPAVPGRLPRLRHRAGRPATSSRGSSPPSTCGAGRDGPAHERHRRARRAGRRRARVRDERARWSGPAGIGKSTLAHPVRQGRGRRGRAGGDLRLRRAHSRPSSAARPGLGMDLRPAIEAGRITIQPIDPAELSPGEFAHAVRRAVEGRGGLPAADRSSSSTASTATSTPCPRSGSSSSSSTSC